MSAIKWYKSHAHISFLSEIIHVYQLNMNKVIVWLFFLKRCITVVGPILPCLHPTLSPYHSHHSDMQVHVYTCVCVVYMYIAHTRMYIHIQYMDTHMYMHSHIVNTLTHTYMSTPVYTYTKYMYCTCT